ncbi:uncharacterized protein N7483_007392 [Penicillium malachiteum]|uniref:uncharacterized protein n=1 Tax=Penicillium malachiteum TaxID=1324776 RepID=UPI0025466460|nr:uncharacterized protein N7483_007392 [Penicillium malachiteum]KAJ5726035.1 hypothetical protein N7483_007392 [Penicillium malachiteum]
MTDLPTFEPYMLTPFDHSTSPIHLTPLFIFHPNNPSNPTAILETGVHRLIALLPFLAGNVTPSSRLQGKENVLEAAPPTREFLQLYPMFRVKHHCKPVQSINEVGAHEDASPKRFAPIPYELAGEDVSPIFRVQANVMLDACCQNPGVSVNRLTTNRLKEEQRRQLIFDASSSISTEDVTHEDNSAHDWEPNGDMASQPSVCDRILLDDRKVGGLKESCVGILKNQPNWKRINLSRTSVFIAALWLSLLRARISSSSGSPSKESCLVIVNDCRSRLDRKLPASYMGNALVVKEVYASIEAVLSSMGPSEDRASRADHLGPRDILLLANLAAAIQSGTLSVTNEYICSTLAGFVQQDDWTPNPCLGDLMVSVIRPFDIHGIDFGPSLGPLKDIDMLESRFPSAEWVVPPFERANQKLWELILSLDPAVIEKMRNDDVMKCLGLSQVVVAKL